MAKHLRLTDLGYFRCHAFEEMERLGIEWQHAEHVGIGDQWWFFNCENVPCELPHYLEELPEGPEHYLKGKDLELVQRYRKTNIFKEMAELAHKGVECNMRSFATELRNCYVFEAKRGEERLFAKLGTSWREILQAVKDLNDQCS